MQNKNLLNAKELCEKLNISSYTLANWYRWENKMIREGLITERYLPTPVIDYSKRGAPRYWDNAMLEQLKEYKNILLLERMVFMVNTLMCIARNQLTINKYCIIIQI